MIRRRIVASRDVSTKMTLRKQERLTVYGFYPNDRGDCDCKKIIENFKDKIATMPPKERQGEIERTGHLVCPRDKTGMKRYEIICANCGQIQGYVWARNERLDDWCDFHYVQWTDGFEWFGCYTPHVSPIDQSLCLECTCGNDTRDFRPNQTLPGRIAYEKEENNRRGRQFGTAQSKFITREVSRDTIRFIKKTTLNK